MHSHPSPSDIQTHLYNSFLHGSTYDVALRVSGSWNAIYKLHRVVLIQSGFFRSLFTAGFAESASRHVSLRNGTDEISVVFDDHNITRAAFEVCISRLYGGGPALYVSPSLIPTTRHPFIPPTSEGNDTPPGMHPATPRFLVSLLATSIYLSIPSIASHALSLVLKTVGPSTVIEYLNFACGKPFDHTNEHTKQPISAVGLEGVAHLLDDDSEAYPQSTLSGDEWKELAPGVDYKEGSVSPPNPAVDSSDSSDSESYETKDDMTSHHYGPVSDKIGEACACWLARWATDILHIETQTIETQTDTSLHPPHDFRTRSKSLSSFDPKAALTLTATSLSNIKADDIPPIFRIGGLTAKWVAAIVSADTLFVKGEKQRYNFARSVVELRRRNGILAHEERIWSTMFAQGIYYNNMTFEDILLISHDMSPTTKQPYVPQSVLQAAHWTQSILRHHIMQRANLSLSPPSGNDPSVKDKELGISFTTADLMLEIANAERTDQTDSERNKVFYPVLGDSSLRIGENGSSPASSPGTQISMDEFFNQSQSPINRHPQAADEPASNRISTTEDSFFGISTSRFTRQACVREDPGSKCRWTPYTPYRFSVEFWDLDLLKEKSRLHSQTIWHAGNLFNVYVQVVRKKGQTQLGIYLHRQSSVDPIPAASSPAIMSQGHNPSANDILSSPVDRASHLRQPSLPSVRSMATPSSPHYSPSIHPLMRSTTASANPNHARSASPPSPTPPSPLPSPLAFNSPSTLTVSAPQQPYRDPRPSVSAYFAISCASATGTSQTRFSSSPDVFTVSQSWGWKSSSLRTEDFMEVGTQPLPNDVHTRGAEVSFRATVLLGLV